MLFGQYTNIIDGLSEETPKFATLFVQLVLRV